MSIKYTSTNSIKTRLYLALVIFFVLSFNFQVSAQFGPNENFKTKDFLVGAHLGIGGGRYFGLGPVINAEYAVLPQLGVTASAGLFSYNDVFSALSSTYSSIPVIIGANWHFDLVGLPEGQHLDTWVGGGVGYTFGSWSSSDPNAVFIGAFGNYFSWDGRVGARYYFSDRFALKLELGYWSLGYVRLGMDFKL